MSKYVLGTVQFGCNYGINNNTGQVKQNEVKKILEICHDRGINTLDTSIGYGNSEDILGITMEETNLQFNIISKYLSNIGSVNDCFSLSIRKLKVNRLYGYLVHHFEDFVKNRDIWCQFKRLKDEGLISKIGFSLYSTTQLCYLLDNKIDFDIIQFPYNMFDRKFESYMNFLYNNGVEIHTRSSFLQGLFFKDLNDISEKLYPLKPYLDCLHNYCRIKNISIENLALGFCLSNPFISGCLIGVDNKDQLIKNLTIEKSLLDVNDINFIQSLNIKETELLNPVNWN